MHVWVAPAVPGDSSKHPTCPMRARVAPAVPGDSSKHLPCQEMALSIALAQPPCRLSPRGSSPRQPCPHRSKRSLPQGSFHTTSPARNSSHSAVPRLPAASSLPGLRDDAHRKCPACRHSRDAGGIAWPPRLLRLGASGRLVSELSPCSFISSWCNCSRSKSNCSNAHRRRCSRSWWAGSASCASVHIWCAMWCILASRLPAISRRYAIPVLSPPPK